MNSKTLSLVISIIALSLTASTFAAPTWDNETGDLNWNTLLNWDSDTLPGAADLPLLDTLPGAVINSAVTGVDTIVITNSDLKIIGNGSISVNDRVIIGNGSGAVGSCTLDVGGELLIRSDHTLMVGQSGGSGTFNMNGGIMGAKTFWIARHAGGASVANFSGGSTPSVATVYVGDAGDGTLNMYGGTLTSIVGDGKFIIANVAGSTGHVNLNAGTILTDSFTMGDGTASMDVTGGILVVDGDVTTTLQGYIDSLLITTSGPGTLTLDYDTINEGKTTLFALPPWAGKATAVSPLHGDIGTGGLKWTGVAGSQSYSVYLSDTESDITSRSPGARIADAYVIANEVPDIAAAGINLIPYEKYYWAVDCEKSGEADLPGDTWHFTAADPIAPNPPNGFNAPISLKQLNWKLPASAGNITCDVHFGTDSDPLNSPKIVNKQAVESVYVNLTASATYYWQLAIYDDNISTTVPYTHSFVYSFTALERQMENLDRSFFAMNIGDGNAFLGWRMLKTDPADISFNIYRNGFKITPTPITLGTNWLHTGQTFLGQYTYELRAVIDSQEQPTSGTFVLQPGSPIVHDMGDNLDPAVHTSFPFSAAVGRSDSIHKIMVGDLNGDGKFDYIVKHPAGQYDPGSGSGDGSETFKIAAFNSDGTFMWEVDLGPNIVLGTWFSPALVYDLDGDGKAEVITKTAPDTPSYRDANGYIRTGPEWFTIYDGETGTPRATEDWIARGDICDWGNCGNNVVNRQQLAIAYLDGVRPSLLIVRGIYEKMVVEAWNFNQDNTLDFLWQWNRVDDAGGGFHSIRTGDIDGDGREEILNGSIAIDDNGKTMWATDEGHGDDLCLADIDPQRPGLEVFYIQEGGYEYPIHLRDAENGDTIWNYGSSTGYGDVGRGLVADIDPTYPGLECWTANPTAGLLSAGGTRIAERPSYSNSFVCEYAYWWGPDMLRELSMGGRMFEYNYLTGGVIRVGTCSIKMAADIVGDWREELIYHTAGEIRIGTPMTVTNEKFYTFMQDPIYRNDISSSGSGYYQSPYTSFYVGSDMTPPTPDAMTWENEPTVASYNSITMTATTATAYGAGGVEYYFECISPGGNDSQWQNSPTYTDTNLQTNTLCTYKVKARGLSHLETAYSNTASAELIAGDFNLDEKVNSDDLEMLANNWLDDCNSFNWCVNGEKLDLSYLNALSSKWRVNDE